MLSGVNPTIDSLLKTCAKLTNHDGLRSEMDFDVCIKKMAAEIREIEIKTDFHRTEEDEDMENELSFIWNRLLPSQIDNIEDIWAEKLLQEQGRGTSTDKSTFREQFKADMESAVRRATDSERILLNSLDSWERNFQLDLNSSVRKLSESINLATKNYEKNLELRTAQYSEVLRIEETAFVGNISEARSSIRHQIDEIIDSNYSEMVSRCATTNRAIMEEYQALFKDLSEYLEAYKKKNIKNKGSPSKKVGREKSESKAATNTDTPSSSFASDGYDATKISIFNGKIPAKTLAFDNFSAVHEMELDLIGDPSARHRVMSNKLKKDISLQAEGVIKTSESALEELRSLYFKKLVGDRDKIVF